jgi:hypothetical protein
MCKDIFRQKNDAKKSRSRRHDDGDYEGGGEKELLLALLLRERRKDAPCRKGILKKGAPLK